MYMRRDASSKNFHVVFLRNAYGMEVDYIENQKLTYKVIGGNFDFKFFIGDKNPEEPIKLYHNYINGWTLHPFWA
jgi:alpha-glucosidase